MHKYGNLADVYVLRVWVKNNHIKATFGFSRYSIQRSKKQNNLFSANALTKKRTEKSNLDEYKFK